MLFFTTLIATSYFLWYIMNLVTLYLEAIFLIEYDLSLVLETAARFTRIVSQQLAFSWILISF